jgi:SAM-dependent methyltransferase
MKDRSGFSTAIVVNPKRYADAETARESRLYPYYAGYSSLFASTFLASLDLPKGAKILDPWNGSGVTTHTAQRFGLHGIGQDLNPVMVLIAKAELLSPRHIGSIPETTRRLLAESRTIARPADSSDALCKWFHPTTAAALRSIERVTSNLIGSKSGRADCFQVANSAEPLVAFFYVVQFRVARNLLKRFRASNPTWTKGPANPGQRVRASKAKIAQLFRHEAGSLFSLLAVHGVPGAEREPARRILLGNSENLKIAARSIDLVFTSPPYCTRIDYAVATAVELAVLRCTGEQFSILRRSLMGTSTVGEEVEEQDEKWGVTCNIFLNRLRTHKSKASKTYYYKNHTQYFRSLFRSLEEISRVMKIGGRCVIVVQDSHYKELRNDVPKVVVEMALNVGLVLDRRVNFRLARSMAAVNKSARKYVERRVTNESVLCFVRQSN